MRIWRIFLFLKAVVNIPIQTVIIPYLISNGVCFSKIKIPYILTKPCHSLCPFSNLKFSFLCSCNSLETYNGKLMGSKTHTSLTRARNFPQQQTVIIPYLISNGVCFSKIKIPYILTKPCHSLCPFSNLKFSFLCSCNSLETYNGKLMGSKTHTSSTRARNFPQLTHSLRDCLRGVMPFYFRNHENIHFTASIFLLQMVKILKTSIFVPNC